MKTRSTARLSLPSLFSSLSVKTSISTRTHVDKNLLILQTSLMMFIVYSSPLSIIFLIGHSMTKTSSSSTMLLGTCQESLLTSDTTHLALALGLVLLPLSSADHQNAGGHTHRCSPRHTRVAQTSDSFSEFRGPFKRQRSSMSVNEGSFELSAKADKLQFFSTRNDFTPYERRGVAQDYGRLTSEELADRVRTLEGT